VPDAFKLLQLFPNAVLKCNTIKIQRCKCKLQLITISLSYRSR